MAENVWGLARETQAGPVTMPTSREKGALIPIPGEAEAEGLQVQGLPEWRSEFKVIWVT